MGTAVFTYCQQQMRDWFFWQQQLENSYHKIILGMTRGLGGVVVIDAAIGAHGGQWEAGVKSRGFRASTD